MKHITLFITDDDSLNGNDIQTLEYFDISDTSNKQSNERLCEALR